MERLSPLRYAARCTVPAAALSCRAPSFGCRRALSHATPLPTQLASLHSSLRAAHIEHSTDVHKWRNPEKEEVRRQFRGGVKLGSEFVKIREQEELEKKMIEEDQFTNWRMVYGFSLGTALLLIGLNLLLAFVEPNPSPEYVPYVDSSASPSEANATSQA